MGLKGFGGALAYPFSFLGTLPLPPHLIRRHGESSKWDKKNKKVKRKSLILEL